MSQFIDLFIKSQQEFFNLDKKIDEVEKTIKEFNSLSSNIHNKLQNKLSELRREQGKVREGLDEMKSRIRHRGAPEDEQNINDQGTKRGLLCNFS